MPPTTPFGSRWKLAIAPLAASKAASWLRTSGPSVRKSPPAQTSPSSVRASALTDVSAENVPFIGGLKAVGCPVFRSMAARLRRSTPPTFVNVPPATTSEPLAPIARTPADWPEGSCLAAAPERGREARSPIGREGRGIDSDDRGLRQAVDERSATDVDRRARRRERLHATRRQRVPVDEEAGVVVDRAERGDRPGVVHRADADGAADVDPRTEHHQRREVGEG